MPLRKRETRQQGGVGMAREKAKRGFYKPTTIMMRVTSDGLASDYMTLKIGDVTFTLDFDDILEMADVITTKRNAEHMNKRYEELVAKMENNHNI